MADVTMFFKTYEAYFRKSLEREREVWWEFISKCDEGTLKNAIDTIEEIFSARRAGGYRAEPPTFPDVKREYWAAKNKTGSTQKYCNENCVQCQGTGSILVVIDRLTRRPLDPDNPRPIPAIDLAYMVDACPHSFRATRRDYRGFGAACYSPEAHAREFMEKCDALYREQLKQEHETERGEG